MRKLFAFAAFVVALVVSSCSYDDTPIWDKLNDHENRIKALEELCTNMNTNIEALQGIVEALEKHDYITEVVETEDGYTINFAKGDSITIKNGKDGANGNDGADGENGADGKDGQTPVIGVAEEGGVYYWTVNGEWLLDENGNKIKAVGTDGKDGENGADGNDGAAGADGNDGAAGADGKDGVTPKLKIENNTWYVSYDNGTTWVELGIVAEGDVVVANPIEVTEDEKNVYFKLSDDQVITIAKVTPLEIEFSALNAGGIFEVSYTVDTTAERVEVEAIAAKNVADVEVVKGEGNTGVINITVGEMEGESKVLVFVGDETRVIMRSIVITADAISFEANTAIEAPAAGGEVELAFISNEEVNVVIPEEAAWISYAEATRTVIEKKSLTLTIEANEGVKREAEVMLEAKNNPALFVKYTIAQEGLIQLATPAVTAEVEGNVVTLAWEAVENAGSYSVTVGTEMPVITEELTYTFTGEYETEYTFAVVAIPADESIYAASEAASVTATTEAEVVGPKAVTVAEFLEASVDDGETYQLTGVITSITNTQYGNFYLKDDSGEILVYGLDLGESGIDWTGGENLNVGDTITITGTRGDYNGTAQVGNGVYVSHVDGEEPVIEAQKVTVAEFLAAAEDNSTMYELTGVITNVANTSYGNFYLTDETGTVYIYGLCSPEGAQKYWAESGAKLGDTITVQTVRTSYANSPQGKNALFVSLVPFVETASEWGVVGDLNGWAAPDVVMYNTWKAKDLFVAYDVEIASGGFKIRANNEWNDAKNYGLEIGGKIYADQYYGLLNGAGSQNITPMAYGTYDVYFDLANERVALVTPGKEYADAVDGGKPVVVIEGLTDHTWGLIGSFEGSGWATDVAMTINGDWAVAENVQLANGNEFKFRADGAWDLSYGSACDVTVGETYTTYNNGGNMKFVGEDGAYNIYFSMVDAKFYMEKWINPADIAEMSITFPGTPSAYTNSYTASFTITLEESYPFEFSSFNNGQESNAWTAIRMGRKANDSVATVVNKVAMPYAVSAVKVNFTQVDTEMNSAKLIVATDEEFANVVEEVTATLAVGEVVYNITAPAIGLYYKLEYDMPATGTNGSYRIDKVTYAK
ncbi:MAG: hypothetical protein J6K40_06105 [Alistipes sp.]|nr:hypothetical protein [Alistipes sp.]